MIIQIYDFKDKEAASITIEKLDDSIRDKIGVNFLISTWVKDSKHNPDWPLFKHVIHLSKEQYKNHLIIGIEGYHIKEEKPLSIFIKLDEEGIEYIKEISKKGFKTIDDIPGSGNVLLSLFQRSLDDK